MKADQRVAESDVDRRRFPDQRERPEFPDGLGNDLVPQVITRSVVTTSCGAESGYALTGVTSPLPVLLGMKSGSASSSTSGWAGTSSSMLSTAARRSGWTTPTSVKGP